MHESGPDSQEAIHRLWDELLDFDLSQFEMGRPAADGVPCRALRHRQCDLGRRRPLDLWRVRIKR
jgi:hypothetical protein